jgi:hypothetical protein
VAATKRAERFYAGTKSAAPEDVLIDILVA